MAKVDGRRGMSLHLQHGDQGRRYTSCPKRCTGLCSGHQQPGLPTASRRGTLCKNPVAKMMLQESELVCGGGMMRKTLWRWDDEKDAVEV